MLRFSSRRRVLIGVILFIYLVLVLIIWSLLHPSQSMSIKDVFRLERLKTPCDCSHAPSSTIASPTRVHIIQNTIPVKTVKLNKTKLKPVTDMVTDDPYPYVDFKLVFPSIVPVIKGSRNIFLIVLVISAAKGEEYRQRRNIIRRTWGSLTSCEQVRATNNVKIRRLRWKLVFVLGKTGPETNDDKLNAEEAKQHNDLLIGNIDDNYVNLIIKCYMAQLWASTFNAKYTMKADDDVYVRIPGVIEYLADENFPSNFYGGYTRHNEIPVRKLTTKWRISKNSYPEDHWPPFNTGGFYILSTDLLGRLFNYVNIRKPFHLEDTYVAVAMNHFGVNALRISSFVISSSMPSYLSEMNNCKILSIVAFGHNVNGTLVHHKIESMCSKNITSKSC